MRQYPKRVYLTKEKTLLVGDESEEIEAGLSGYETHWNKDVNERQKGTEKEILRSDPVDPVDPVENKLSPQQRAAITRAKNKAAKEG